MKTLWPSRLCLGLLSILLLLGAADAATESPASAKVHSSSQQILDEIAKRRAEFTASPAALEAYVHQQLDVSLDIDYSARLVLGIHSRKASPEQIKRFAKALTDNLVRRYASALLDAKGDSTIRMLGETTLGGGKFIRVKTNLVGGGSAQPVAVDYLMRQVGGEWLAFDVIVEGISYVQTFRSQFDPLIRSKGLDAVSDDLEQGRIEVATDVADK